MIGRVQMHSAYIFNDQSAPLTINYASSQRFL